MKAAIFALFSVLFASHSLAAEKKIIDPNNIFPQVKLETSMGVMIVELNRIKAPIAVNNFLYHVITKEYDNTLFHRVIEDFVVQGGGYDVNYIPKKVGDKLINESGNGLKNETSTIAMARENDPHSATRQFYFNVSDNNNLDPGRNWGYTVFGEVTYGQDIIQQMALVETGFNEELGWKDVPVKPLVLLKATLMPADYIHQADLTP
ncbi:peptidylprolyl isomerase [Thalassotalea aquiviva]|uniref:peptidylprolyl isomerase n=1 Tax=Thalassotalea aquiviva TaxID=3242415 RepID=UPI00352AEBBE